MYVILHIETQTARVIGTKTYLAEVLQVDKRTIARNEHKLPYERNGFKVFPVQNGVEKTKKHKMSYPRGKNTTNFFKNK